MSANVQFLTLPNGLHVSLCSAPRLKRCAAALRVAAGSHDVPAQWPGLAHFLEHLFFLGTERFPADEKLMAFVQRHGGQINASTRERTTDFFFELPQTAFADGLERLCDMLSHPLMKLEDQLREREVLHAEFIAWSRDEAARSQTLLLAPVCMSHPLRWFHAGNRFSLPVPRQAFQQALQDFYRQFYQAGQMTLSLAGPQSLEELTALVTKLGNAFVSGSKVEQLAPPRLLDRPLEDTAFVDPQRMHLTFACEGLPDGAEQAAEFFCTWVNSAQPGGLIAELRERGLIESLKAQVLYQFGGQVLLDIDVALTEAVAGQTTQISALFFNWLDFFKTRFSDLLNEFTLLQQRRLAVGSALTLARHHSHEHAGLRLPAISALLDQLTPAALLHPQTFSPVDNVPWRLPKPNPFLRPVAMQSTTQTKPLPSLTFSDALPANNEAVVYLRWTLPSPQPKLHQVLSDSLKPLIADALQAGVTLAFSAYGNHWQLQLAGLSEPIPTIAEHALNLLRQPDNQTLARYNQPLNEPTPIPIRQLLNTLPDHFLHSAITAESADPRAVWADAHWIGFATGLTDSNQQALLGALQTIPGHAFAQTPAALKPTTARRWQAQHPFASEAAVLLFCPAPSQSVEDEATWRFFAQLIQAPFYQRLRVELQLGYAVFSGLRQICGHTGLLFGVQSPSVNAENLVRHIESVIQTLPTLIAQADLPGQLSALRTQLDPQTMDTRQGAEMLWQAHLAGLGPNYLALLQHSLATLNRETLLSAAGQLTSSVSTRLYLANRSKPDETWQT